MPCRLMNLPSAGGISGNRATVRLTTTSATSSTTTDQTTRRPSRSLEALPESECVDPVGQVAAVQ